MKFEQAIDSLKPNLKAYVERVTSKSKYGFYVCPLCGSGTRKGTGAFRINEKNNELWKCFSCNEHGDIFDLIGKVERIESFPERVKKACEIFNISLDGNSSNSQGKDTPPAEQGRAQNASAGAPEKKDSEAKPKVDFTNFYEEAHSKIGDTNYHRGLSQPTLDRFKIGYVEKWIHPNAGQIERATPTPRLIIPTSKESYIARATDGRIDCRIMKVGTTHFLNIEALKNAQQPIFIVEGEIDALSIIDVGGEAIALGSTSLVNKFAQYLKDNVPIPAQPLVLALDNDEAGKKASDELAQKLSILNIPFYVDCPFKGCKDANYLLELNRNELQEGVEVVEERIREEEEARKEEERRAYLKNTAYAYIPDFVNGIKNNVDTPYICTGFNELDEILDGGLYEGLYIVGAISSLGKTTLVLQIADQIAKTGEDVLIFSLEMARTELMAKSISRLTFERAIDQSIERRYAKTTRGITSSRSYERYGEIEKNLIRDSIMDYSKYAEHIFINEGIGDIGADKIREVVDKHIRITGNKPVVIVDYLQIIAPYNERATDKQNTDKAVLELKRISRDYKIPIIGVSSFNRENYKEEVSMKAFKESGAIEYSSDVLMGLQLKGAGSKDFDEQKEKKKEPREVELVILKNRNGKTGVTVEFDYYPLFNYFEETGSEELRKLREQEYEP